MAPDICTQCGHNNFNMHDGFYFCGACGNQSQAMRHYEQDMGGVSTRGCKVKPSRKPTRTPTDQPVISTKKPEVGVGDLTDRAIRSRDFPSYMFAVGYRLCTFTKLVVKVSHLLVFEYGVPEICKKYSILLLQSYFRKFRVAFCDSEVGKEGEQNYTPVLLRTVKEMKKLKAEAKKKLAEAKVERKKKRLSQLTMFEALTQDEPTTQEDEFPEEVDVMKSISTKISVKTLKAASVIYLEVDMVLLIVYVAALYAGCQWIQISDLFRWYREGRFEISRSQICALYPAADWKIGVENNKPVRRSFFHVFDGILPLSQNIRTLAFIAQFIQIPKSIVLMDFSMVLARTIYNLGLPREFSRQVDALRAHLPPVDASCDASAFRRLLPLVANFEENYTTKASKFGPMTFFAFAFDEYPGPTQSPSNQWLLIPPEVKAMALVLLALKMFFGLDDRRESLLEPIDADEADPFDYKQWFLQLKLRLNVWQGKRIDYVLSQNFECVFDERTTKWASLYEQRSTFRFTNFQKCVPNFVRYPRAPKFECIFGDESSKKNPNDALSNDALYAPLRFQAVKHKKYWDLQRCGVSPLTSPVVSSVFAQSNDNKVDPASVELFFKSFTDSHLNLRLASTEELTTEDDAPYAAGHRCKTTMRKRKRVTAELSTNEALFPCADHYMKIVPLTWLNCMTSLASSDERISKRQLANRRIFEPLIEWHGVAELHRAARFHFSHAFADILRHLAVIVGETEELLFFTFAIIENMFTESVALFEKDLRAGKSKQICEAPQLQALDVEAPSREFLYLLNEQIDVSDERNEIVMDENASDVGEEEQLGDESTLELSEISADDDDDNIVNDDDDDDEMEAEEEEEQEEEQKEKQEMSRNNKTEMKRQKSKRKKIDEKMKGRGRHGRRKLPRILRKSIKMPYSLALNLIGLKYW